MKLARHYTLDITPAKGLKTRKRVQRVFSKSLHASSTNYFLKHVPLAFRTYERYPALCGPFFGGPRKFGNQPPSAAAFAATATAALAILAAGGSAPLVFDLARCTLGRAPAQPLIDTVYN